MPRRGEHEGVPRRSVKGILCCKMAAAKDETVPHIATDRRTTDASIEAEPSSNFMRWRKMKIGLYTYRLEMIAPGDQISNVMRIDQFGVLFAQTAYLRSTQERSGSMDVPGF